MHSVRLWKVQTKLNAKILTYVSQISVLFVTTDACLTYRVDNEAFDFSLKLMIMITHSS